MRLTLQATPWYSAQPTPQLLSAIEALAAGVWSEAAVRFYAERAAKVRRGSRASKGMQSELNQVISEHLARDGWAGDGGRFIKDHTWLRVTFRHQMSLGSDLIDAMKVCKKEGCEQAVIAAASARTLRTISPNDAAALVSFEKLRIAVADLKGVTDIPLLIGCLEPVSAPSEDIGRALEERRPRDVTVPMDRMPRGS